MLLKCSCTGEGLFRYLHSEAAALYFPSESGVHTASGVQSPRAHHIRPRHPLPTGLYTHSHPHDQHYHSYCTYGW